MQETYEMSETVETVIGEGKCNDEFEGGPECRVRRQPFKRVEKLWEILPANHVLHCCRGNNCMGMNIDNRTYQDKKQLNYVSQLFISIGMRIDGIEMRLVVEWGW